MITRRLDVTVNSSGDGSATGNAVLGALYAVQLVDGTFADGVDVVITAEQGELSIPLLTKANFNTDQIVYPRVLEALNTDGTALATYAMPLVVGNPKVVVAQGGTSTSGSFILYVIEL
jgi:hypothetical protein